MNYNNLKRAKYYWDWYIRYKRPDDLVAANSFYLDYKRKGGQEIFKELERAVDEIVKFEIKISNKLNIKESRADEIFGMSWDELEWRQGGKLTKK